MIGLKFHLISFISILVIIRYVRRIQEKRASIEVQRLTFYYDAQLISSQAEGGGVSLSFLVAIALDTDNLWRRWIPYQALLDDWDILKTEEMAYR